MIMKKRLFLPAVIGLMSISTLFQSCLDDNDDKSDLLRPSAVVTVRPATDGSFTMILDEKTTLRANNMPQSPYGKKEVRALVNFTEEDGADLNKQFRDVKINWIDSIRTKEVIWNANPEVSYGDDPIEIVADWVTVAEDGYLTLRVRTRWDNPTTPHLLNLVAEWNNEKQLADLYLHHDANGDLNGVLGDAMIAFNVTPFYEAMDCCQESKKVRLHWNSFRGNRTTEFELGRRIYNDVPKLDAAAIESMRGRNVK